MLGDAKKENIFTLSDTTVHPLNLAFSESNLTETRLTETILLFCLRSRHDVTSWPPSCSSSIVCFSCPHLLSHSPPESQSSSKSLKITTHPFWKPAFICHRGFCSPGGCWLRFEPSPDQHTQHTGSVSSVGFEFTWNYNCLYACVLLCSAPNVIFNAKMLFLVSTFKVTPLAPYVLRAAALQRTSWLASILPDWFDATVRPLWCLDLTRVAFLACLIIPLSLLTSHFILRSTWSAVDNRAGLELFIARYNKSAEFNMGSVLWASSGSQSRSPPVETSIRPQTVSDGFTVSFDCLDRQAWPRFIERYDKSLREGIFFTIFFLDVTSAEFVRHRQQTTGCSGTAKWDL